MSDTPLTHLVLQLPLSTYQRLMQFITDPDHKHISGGYQNRKEKWRTRINEAVRSIELDGDDIDWVQRQIINQKGGGWQKKIAVIFAGRHLLFTRLPIAPRKKPEDRKHRS